MAPAGLDRRTALRVRRDVLKGRRVDNPEWRSAAEYYVGRIGRANDLQSRLHPLHIVLAAAFAAVATLSLLAGHLSENPWFAIVMASNAVMWSVQAILGPAFWNERRRRLEVNRPGVDGLA